MEKITGELSKGAKYAEGCRTSGANSMAFEPPKGPEKEPTKVNGIKAPKERNISSGNK